MSIIKRPVYGEAKPTNFLVQCGVFMESPMQARFMRKILEEAMIKYAGKPEETLLAKWHRNVQQNFRSAEKRAWVGWEEDK
jgi:hypothetical protein